jgi:hypothetical protein
MGGHGVLGSADKAGWGWGGSEMDGGVVVVRSIENLRRFVLQGQGFKNPSTQHKVFHHPHYSSQLALKFQFKKVPNLKYNKTQDLKEP